MIELGRRYKDSQRKADKYEALRLMGTGLHCLEGQYTIAQFTVARGLSLSMC
jgi:hypothetical protein